MKKIIAITGGIGSGKSSVLEIVRDLGYKTLSCDGYTQKVYQEKKTLKKLKRAFPTAVDDGGNVDRKKLSEIVFLSEEKYAVLSKLITLRIFKAVMKDAKREKGLVFVEVPLLFEYGFQNRFKSVLVVKRNINDRIDGVKKRSGLTDDEIKKRIQKQYDYENGNFEKYIVIDNSGDKDSLKEKVVETVKSLIE